MKSEEFAAAEVGRAVGNSSLFTFHSSLLKGQIIRAALTRWLLSGRERGCRSIRLRREGCCHWGAVHRYAGNGLLSLATNNAESPDLIEPTTIILMGIDVELHGEILAVLNVELLNAIFAEDTEHAFAGISTWYLDDIFLRHPGVTSSG